jgi:hypothetical protein
MSRRGIRLAGRMTVTRDASASAATAPFVAAAG